ncbi:hypothetical protein AB0F43_26110 [Kribbella sp. NPDC023972]|uniref:hypothetical protein n=1 Tax=Kribbella sp. NPDC023972 TaxID=3154795 RepID=UPI0033F1E8A2
MRRTGRLCALTCVLALVSSGCSVARRADGTPSIPSPPGAPAVVPTVIAPPQAQGLDGTAGAPGPQVCTTITGTLTASLHLAVTAKPNTWNDGGLPSMDLCTLLVEGWPVTIGVTALPRQSDSLDRLLTGTSSRERLSEVGPDAWIAESRIVFSVGDRAVRITRTSALDRAGAVAIAVAARDAVPKAVRNARQSDAACQVSTPAAERFVGARAQLRRDYRMNGALTCIWGTYDATVSIVEAFGQQTIPEARRVPPPHLAPIGRPGYYLPGEGELVFRHGRRVVRVAGLTSPAREIPLETLLGIVGPLLPLFLR